MLAAYAGESNAVLGSDQMGGGEDECETGAVPCRSRCIACCDNNVSIWTDSCSSRYGKSIARHQRSSRLDGWSSEVVAVSGFMFLIPTLILLHLPAGHAVQDRKNNITLYCALLAVNGVNMAVINSPGIVDSDVVQKYDKANPGFFGENVPYT